VSRSLMQPSAADWSEAPSSRTSGCAMHYAELRSGIRRLRPSRPGRWRASFWPGLACGRRVPGGGKSLLEEADAVRLQRRADELVERIAGLFRRSRCTVTLAREARANPVVRDDCGRADAQIAFQLNAGRRPRDRACAGRRTPPPRPILGSRISGTATCSSCGKNSDADSRTDRLARLAVTEHGGRLGDQLGRRTVLVA